MATGSSTHNLTFSYDRFGNMTCVTNAQTNGPCPNWSFNSATNRISNAFFTYDAAGNLTKDGKGAGTHTYQWDAENRLKSVDTGSTASYTYNALGQRVEKLVGTAYTEVAYDASAEPVGENNRTSWTQDFVPLGGRHLAHYASGGTYFPHANSLASTSQFTDYTGVPLLPTHAEERVMPEGVKPPARSGPIPRCGDQSPRTRSAFVAI